MPAPYSIDEMEAHIRRAALQRGIDPEIALKVARSEGLQPGTWQSNVVKGGVREPSYGPFQLYKGGGLGNDFQKATGLDPADPSTAYQGVDFALDKAANGGWGPWYGAKTAGVAPMQGIPELPPQRPPSPGFVPTAGLDGQGASPPSLPPVPVPSMPPGIPGLPAAGLMNQGMAAAQSIPPMLEKLKATAQQPMPGPVQMEIAKYLPASMTGADSLKQGLGQGIESLQNMFKPPIPAMPSMASAAPGIGAAASASAAPPLGLPGMGGIFSALAGLGQQNQQQQQQNQQAISDADRKRVEYWLRQQMEGAV